MTATIEAPSPTAADRLTEGSLACAACGISTPRPVEQHGPDRPSSVFTVDAYLIEGDRHGARSRAITTELTRCPICTGITGRAMKLCVDHPEIGRRLGDRTSIWRVETALSGLAAIGVTPSAELLDSSFGALLRLVSAAGAAVRWQMRCAPTVLVGGGPGWCAPSPWACAPPAALDAVKEGWSRLLAERVAEHRPPVAVPCPPGGLGGCALCGASAVTVTAVRAARDRSVWTATRVAVGSETVDASLCPGCAEAVAAVGSVGPSAAELACLAWLRSVGREKDATALRAALNGPSVAEGVVVEGPALTGARVVPFATLPPRTGPRSSRPWSHLRLPG